MIVDAEPRAAAHPSPARLAFAPPGTLALPGSGLVAAPRTGRHRAPGGFVIRRMSPEDLPFVVPEYLENFPEGFFARLGPAFLTAQCRTYLASPHARALIAEAEGIPVAFLLGVTDPAAHRCEVLGGHRRTLLLRGLAGLALRPRLALHFVRTRLGRYLRKLMPGGRAVPDPALVQQGITAVLAYVAVSSRARSGGIGGALIDQFVADAYASGCARVSLVTAVGDSGAGPYYERRGWLPRGETRTPEGRRLAAYDLPLREPCTPGTA
ncbi:GNAT superfamily N-acetyltransferase [Streptomyces sp. SAI-090]|nr:GNAT superfamily N-acetyltransferase [Streptomyces sp. SAI-090]